MVRRHLEIFPEGHDDVHMIKNLIKHLEREFVEVKTDLKRLIVLKREIATLKQKLGELECPK